MTYFLKQGNSYQSKNRLQLAAKEATSTLDGLLVGEPEAVTKYLARLVDELNPKFPKCYPLSLRVIKQSNLNFYISDSRVGEGILISFTLFPVLGSLDSLPNDESQIHLIGHVEKEVANV